jgi:PmbA protein
MTVKDIESGDKFSGHWWESSLKYKDLQSGGCAEKALERAVSQIGPKKRKGGRYRMIVDRTVSSRLVAPIINALNAQSIQQKVSFLEGSMGKKIFSEGFTLMDYARSKGKPGARMYDYEGVATEERAIIDKGSVQMYFVSTYMSGKSGMEPTVDGVSHPVLLPYMKDGCLDKPEKDVSLKDILAYCGNGIYVTGFNGGNCNPVSGDFSFGIEGFAIRNGKILHPVREMLITGNIITLWNSLIAAGSDARDCSRWQIPTLAFENVSFASEV